MLGSQQKLTAQQSGSTVGKDVRQLLFLSEFAIFNHLQLLMSVNSLVIFQKIDSARNNWFRSPAVSYWWTWCFHYWSKLLDACRLCCLNSFQSIFQMLWFICWEKLDSLWRLSVNNICGYVCKRFSKRLKMRVEANIFPGLFVAGCRWGEMTRFRTSLLLRMFSLPSISLENIDWGGKNNSLPDWSTFFYLRWRGFYLFVLPQCLSPHHEPRPLCELTDLLQTWIPAFWGSCSVGAPGRDRWKQSAMTWSIFEAEDNTDSVVQSLKPRMSTRSLAEWSETFHGSWGRCTSHKHGFNLREPICGSMTCDEKETLVFRKRLLTYFSASPISEPILSCLPLVINDAHFTQNSQAPDA